MYGQLTINLSKPLKSAAVITSGGNTGLQPDVSDADSPATVIEPGMVQAIETEKAQLQQLQQAIKSVADKLDNFYSNLFAGQRENIANLSVEIARKILAHKIEKEEYEIESIVKEALENAPAAENIEVHLNPADYARYQNLFPQEQENTNTCIQFVSDPKVGKAECLLVSPKGIITSLIDEHLERIRQALLEVN